MPNGRWPAPSSPSRSAGRGSAGLICAKCSTRCSTSWAQAANGALCPKTCLHAAPCTTTLCVGSVTARWGVCTMLSTSKRASWPARRRAPRQRSWTARASKEPKGGRRTDPVGFDAAKKVKGRKRHAVVDTLGLMLGCAVLPGNVQDRDGCLGVLTAVRRLFPFLERVIADGAYQGRKTARAVRRAARARLEIVKRCDAAKGFVVLQKRWIVERTFGWLGRCRRLAKDFEALTRTHLAFVQLAMIRLMLRRIARASQSS